LGIERAWGDVLEMDIKGDDGRIITVEAHAKQFGANLLDERDQDVALLDYGYAVTAHKSQGSEWDQVIVCEEISRSWDARRWRYTTTTRAKERILYFR
jgi:ATP-dependent exoDNAse (exonuclease V) alpha subunit